MSPDEACPNYNDLIANMALGHQFLKQEFGVRPKVSWNIDAKGHSAMNTWLLSQMGFDAQFVTFIDKDLKKKMLTEEK